MRFNVLAAILASTAPVLAFKINFAEAGYSLELYSSIEAGGKGDTYNKKIPWYDIHDGKYCTKCVNLGGNTAGKVHSLNFASHNTHGGIAELRFYKKADCKDEMSPVLQGSAFKLSSMPPELSIAQSHVYCVRF
ncbi:hypothetical protein BJ138DRAFT_1104106 [Hygrophoropsis aurantiaca]|uniref:Uncharacterized protein n=1 Tax=Hygrophoropsis aurantiaca TaxID=72124 RepID=A0ACB8A4L2_9AGAM|nr:hypothetical protein BJ138DRAFT_1104106 [Hygrophoropsis aurantiaca]